jgi:Lon protease-like protein
MHSALAMFPLSTVLVPGATLRLHIFEERYKIMIGECIAGRGSFGVVLDRAGRETGPDLDPVDVGTAAEICEVSHLDGGRLFIVTRGTRRFRVERFLQREPYIEAVVEYLDEPVGDAGVAVELRNRVEEQFKDYLRALLATTDPLLDSIELPDDTAASSYLIADAMHVEPAVKQRLLEADSATVRLSDELATLAAETERLRTVNERRRLDPMQSVPAPFDVRFSRN